MRIDQLSMAPFLHGSARNEAYRSQPSVYFSAPASALTKLPAKPSSASTWVEGIAETIARRRGHVRRLPPA